jgi:hypothetical protein
MQRKGHWAKAAAILAGLNLAAPQALICAADSVSAKAKKTPAAQDVSLTSAGELTGRVVTAQGVAVDGADVSLLQNGKLVARTNSDAQGEFRVADVKGGVYQVSAGKTVQYVRAWSDESAPPAARPVATIVQGNVVRGQDEWDYFETDEMVIAGIATAALVVGVVALVEADDDDNRSVASP